jgi:2'-5' RNA ligase superfamily
MAIISGSEFWRKELRRLPVCRAVLDQVLKNGRAFRVDFRGVTVSPDAVMIQGFPADAALAQLRDDLRAAFRQHGLGDNLDRRYKTSTAHLTVMRFSEPEANWERLHYFLQAHRKTDFGETHFQSLQLIWSRRLGEISCFLSQHTVGGHGLETGEADLFDSFGASNCESRLRQDSRARIPGGRFQGGDRMYIIAAWSNGQAGEFDGNRTNGVPN